jgi:hypothetical protein
MRVPDARGLEWVAAAVPDSVTLGPVYANRRGAIAIARFTGVDWEMRARIESLVARAGGSARPA